MIGHASVTAEDVRGGRHVSVSGEIDLANVDLVRESIIEAITSDPLLVVLDLSRTTYLDSTGIALLFKLGQLLTHRRQTLRLVVPEQSPIRAVLDLTRVGDFIPIDSSFADGAASSDVGIAPLPGDQ
jgi:anti-anti-sigma factor